jgi:TRAP-type C4-dicarboxylate transport system permease small subunit
MVKVERFLLSIEKALVWIAVVAMTILMLLTTADALMRYLFNAPITGAYEITEKYLMTFGIFLAFSYGYRGDVFIRVSFLVERLPRAVRMVLDHVAQVATAVYCVFFAYSSLDQAIKGMDEGATLSAVAVPLAPSYFLVPIGFAAMAILVLYDIPKVRKGESRLLPTPVEGDAGQSAT